MPPEAGFQRRMQRIEALIGELNDAATPDVRDGLGELVSAVLELHAVGLARLIELADAPTAAGAPSALAERLAADPLVASLLLLHDLHPHDVQTRILGALEGVRPYLASHGGSVQLLGVSEAGVVRLKLEGSCNGCASSRITMQYGIQDAIFAAAPEVTDIEVDGLAPEPVPAAGFVSLADLAGGP